MIRKMIVAALAALGLLVAGVSPAQAHRHITYGVWATCDGWQGVVYYGTNENVAEKTVARYERRGCSTRLVAIPSDVLD